eukprot:ctg_344.g220
MASRRAVSEWMSDGKADIGSSRDGIARCSRTCTASKTGRSTFVVIRYGHTLSCRPRLRGYPLTVCIDGDVPRPPQDVNGVTDVGRGSCSRNGLHLADEVDAQRASAPPCSRRRLRSPPWGGALAAAAGATATAADALLLRRALGPDDPPCRLPADVHVGVWGGGHAGPARHRSRLLCRGAAACPGNHRGHTADAACDWRRRYRVRQRDEREAHRARFCARRPGGRTHRGPAESEALRAHPRQERGGPR